MSYRRDIVSTTTTQTPEGGPVRWWLLVVGVLAVLTVLTWGFAASVQGATVSDAKDALADAGLESVTVGGATYRDVRLVGPAGDEVAARTALDGLTLVYGVSYEPTGNEAIASPSPSASATEQAQPTEPAAASPSATPTEAPTEAPTEVADLPELAGIQFETGSTTLAAASTGVLDQAAAAIVAALPSHPNLHVAINGYTDSQGDPAANRALSQQRAEAVSAYLASRGVPAEVLSATGFGDANPIASNDTADGRAANRRVDFVSTEG